MPRALTLALALLPAAAWSATPVTAIKAGRLLDVERQKVLENVVIVVENGRIKEVGSAVPAGATVIDLGRHHVLPGFIDGHTHVLLQGDATAGRLRRAAAQGVAALPRAARRREPCASRSTTASRRCATSATRAAGSPTST